MPASMDGVAALESNLKRLLLDSAAETTRTASTSEGKEAVTATTAVAAAAGSDMEEVNVGSVTGRMSKMNLSSKADTHANQRHQQHQQQQQQQQRSLEEEADMRARLCDAVTRDLWLELEDLRKVDPCKGLEVKLRSVCRLVGVAFEEYWPFLACMANLGSGDGFQRMEDYFATTRRAFIGGDETCAWDVTAFVACQDHPLVEQSNSDQMCTYTHTCVCVSFGG